MPISSSSSSSSNSSSSSSSSELISSSSSSGYCMYPDCEGAACVNFSGWNIVGGTTTNIPDGLIYIRFNILGSEQQVELYSDPNYYNLIALGKGSVGTIALLDSESSGVSGTVVWNGTYVDFEQTAILSCTELSSSSSSSSTSSLDSSSSSSDSSNSSSSSSSQCCTSPYSTGAASVNFSNWTLTNPNDANTFSCHLWIGFDKVGSQQQVRIYKDSAMSELVALGQASSAGTIYFYEIDDSNLSGTVVWNGTYVDYGNVGELDCAPFSSSSSSSSSDSSQSSSSSVDSSSSSSKDSSSSSTSESNSSSSSSIDSSSSSSSSSDFYSSSSSVSTSSSSSESTQSSSSSSSIDSSSSSSESVGNTSSSSSSDLVIWNRTKPLLKAHVAIKNVEANNEIAQSLYFPQSSYRIGKIFCYFYGPFGNVDSGTINLSVYEADSDGKPSVLVQTSSINSSEITENGWYSFDFSIDETTPASKWLSFVMNMTNLNEDNYVLWGYDEKIEGKSFVKGNADWVETHELRALKISSSFELFDFENYSVNSEGAILATEITELNSQNQINHPKCMISVVIDSSGSNGWSDRFNNRKDLVSKIFDRFSQKYPDTFVFDYIKVGAQVVDTSDVLQNFGTLATINFDLSVPSRTSYSFITNGNVGVTKGAIYSIGDETYTALSSGNYISVLVLLGANDPTTAEGTLTLESGTGNSTVDYSSWRKATIANSSVIAYGYKNLESNHTYDIAEMKLENNIFDKITIQNWQIFGNTLQTGEFSIGNHGPKSTEALRAVISNNPIIRKPLSNFDLKKQQITTLIPLNGSEFSVDSATTLQNTEVYDLVSGDLASVGHKITSISGENITLSENTAVEIPSYTANKSIIQTSTAVNPIKIKYSTLKLLVKDTQSSRPITFFLQTNEGLPIEWDFQAFKDWRYTSLFWIGESASLEFLLNDSSGDPLKDGTRIDLVVDKPIDESQETSFEISLTRNALAGEDLIFVEDISNLEVGDKITIISPQTNISEKLEIAEKGISGELFYIVSLTVLENNFLTTTSSYITKNKNINPQISSTDFRLKTNIKLPLIDITPILAEKNRDASDVEEYDTNSVPYTSEYEDLDTNVNYIKFGQTSLMTIDGVAGLRLPPITDDVILSSYEKKKSLESLLEFNPSDKVSDQLIRNSADVVPQISETEVFIGKDYTIETPIYLKNGNAKSRMSSFASEFENTEIAYANLPGTTAGEGAILVIPVKSYDVSPSLTTHDSLGSIVAKLNLRNIDVNFAYPDSISSSMESKNVEYTVWSLNEDLLTYATENFRGVYADDEDIVFSYIVTNKLSLLKNGTLRIKIYYNSIVNLDSLATSIHQASINEATTDVFANSETVLSKTFIKTPSENEVGQNENGETILTEIPNPITSWQEQVDENTVAVSNGSDLVPLKAISPYDNASEWILATHYDNYDFDITITDGKASFTLPANKKSGLVMIEASFASNEINDFEVIKTDMIFVANPIGVGAPIPSTINLSNDKTIAELGFRLTWKGETFGTIEDGTELNISNSETEVNPNTSQSIDGWAGGLVLGPHALVEEPELEKISVRSLHSSGYVADVIRPVLWKFNENENENTFEFHVFAETVDLNDSALEKIWTDGSRQAKIKIDLNSSINSSIIETNDGIVPKWWVGDYGKARLKGLEQENEVPELITVISTNEFSQQVTKDLLYFSVNEVNKNIGNGRYSQHFYEAHANYFFLKDTKKYLNIGNLVTRYYNSVEAADPNFEIPYPALYHHDPLKIEMYIEEYNGKLNRDGVLESTIIAAVSWKDSFLKNTVAVNGSEINYPLPQISFSAATESSQEWKLNRKKENDIWVPIDNRGDISSYIGNSSGILLPPKSNEINLNKYSASLSLIRTSIHTSGNNSHVHVISLDQNGNGSTTRTIVLKGSVDDHAHAISNYVVENSSYSGLVHNHSVQSVAEIKVLPLDDEANDFAIQALVTYDPTNCEPYGNEIKVPFENRKAFDGIADRVVNYDPEKIKKLEIEVSATNNVNYTLGGTNNRFDTLLSGLNKIYTAETIDETEKGINFKINAYFTEHTIINDDGSTTVVPQQAISDGTRVHCSMEVYKPELKNNVLEIRDGSERRMMLIKLNIKMIVDNYLFNKDYLLPVSSLLVWIPGVNALSYSPDNTETSTNGALDKIEAIGTSQIMDGVKLAAQRATQYIEDNSLTNYKHVILVMSDFDENKSTTTVNGAIREVNWINGTKLTPVFTIKTGSNDALDSFLANKLSLDTNGKNYNIFNANNATMIDVVDEFVKNEFNVSNNSLLEYSFELENLSPIKSISLNDFVNTTNTSGEFRYRLSSDEVNWTDWSAWSDIQEVITEASNDEYRHIEFELNLHGNENFESPVLNEGFSVNYLKKQSTIINFQPIYLDMEDDEYVSAIHFTYEGSVPSSSIIQFGIGQTKDFTTWINGDETLVSLTRFNEKLLTENYITYSAINGAWDRNLTIEIHEVSGENPKLISSNQYSANPESGTVSFYSPKNKELDFTISLSIKKTLYLSCKITNFKEEEAGLDHVGVMYSIGKRIPKDSKGNTIYSPLYKRILST